MSLLYEPSPVPFRPHAPSWRQPLYLHFRPLWAALRETLQDASGHVLDIGCGMQPYRELLGPRVTEYVGVDREGELTRPTVIGTAEALPFGDASFDTVLSTQVLEHVTHPDTVLREAVRVLKPGGLLVLTVPGVWPTHEPPHDYWRFTRHGLIQLLDRSGATLEKLTPLGGLWSAVGQMMNLELQRAPIARELVPIVNLAARFLERRGAVEDLALTWLATAVRAR